METKKTKNKENYLLDLVKNFPEILKKEKLVVLLADGLGLTNLYLPFLRKSIYRTVFPSSTPTFLYSFFSLLEPKEHGFLEWFMHFKGVKKPVIIPPWTTLDGKTLKLKKNEIFPYKSLFEILFQMGISSFFYLPYPDSIFSQSVSKKAKVKGIKYLSQVFPLPKEDFVLIYWPSPDELLHKGFRNETFEIDKKFLELFIKILYQKLLPKSQLIVLSDHGLTKITKRYKLPKINSYPVGGSRVAFYKGKKEKVERELRKIKMPVLVYEIAELKFFKGKINKRCVENFGNIVVMAKENIGFIYPFEKSPPKLMGGHGGLTQEETFVNVWFGKK